MKIDTNSKIAAWLGWKWNEPSKRQTWDPYWSDETGMSVQPNRTFFDESDEAAIVLLPILKEKYKNKFVKVMLESMSSNGHWFFTIGLMEDGAEDYYWIESDKQPTIAQAISAAVVLLIDSI